MKFVFRKSAKGRGATRYLVEILETRKGRTVTCLTRAPEHPA
jgi:hypothetical protein